MRIRFPYKPNIYSNIMKILSGVFRNEDDKEDNKRLNLSDIRNWLDCDIERDKLVSVLKQIEIICRDYYLISSNIINSEIYNDISLEDMRYTKNKIRYLLISLSEETIFDTIQEDKFVYELCKIDRLVTNEDYPYTSLLFHLALPISKKTLAEAEQHNNSGFHIHYSVKKKRVNVIYLFNCKDLTDNSLYWEHHASGKNSPEDPESYGKSKKELIYEKCKLFLNKINQLDFQSRSNNSRIFYPI